MSVPAERPVCVHYASTYLPLTENWIYRVLINHSSYTPVFIARKKANRDLFPADFVYCLDDLGVIRKYLEILWFRLTGYFRFFRAVCQRRNASILHVHFGYHGAKMTGLKRALGIPMVCSFYGDDAYADRFADRYSLLFRHVNLVLVLGEAMKARLTQLGCPPEKITVHHLGIDVGRIRFVPRIIDAGKPVRFLMASSFVRKKGIDIALRAFALIREKHEFTVDLVGDGPLKGELIKLMETLGIRDRVTLHGYKPYDEVIELCYSCDVFVQASRTTEGNNKEGTPMAIVDAMASGMPVVSTLHSDIPEIVLHEETGYLAKENDVEDFARCLKRVFSEPGRIHHFSRASRHRIEKEFDARTQTMHLEDYYTKLLDKGKSGFR